jgi:hypothetical protein
MFNTFAIYFNASIFLSLLLQSTHERSHNSEYSVYSSINLYVSSIPHFRIAMLESISLAQNYAKCPNTCRHNCVRTWLNFNCCCFVFVLSTLRWLRSPVRETGNRTQTFWSLPTGAVLGRVAENTNICRGQTAKLQKCFTSVAELLQILRRGSAGVRLLPLRVRIAPGGMDVYLLWVLCVVR